MKYNIKWESNEKKRLYYGESRSITFAGSAHTMSFAAFSWWEIDVEVHAFPIWRSIP